MESHAEAKAELNMVLNALTDQLLAGGSQHKESLLLQLKAVRLAYLDEIPVSRWPEFLPMASNDAYYQWKLRGKRMVLKRASASLRDYLGEVGTHKNARSERLGPIDPERTGGMNESSRRKKVQRWTGVAVPSFGPPSLGRPRKKGTP
jgi:hypothetical protein